MKSLQSLRPLALLAALTIGPALAQTESVRIDMGAGGMSMSVTTSGESADVTMRTIEGYGDAVIIDRARLLTTLGDLNEELARLQGVTAGGDRNACRRASGDLSALRSSIRLLIDDLRAAPGIDTRGPVAAPPPPMPAPEPLPPPVPAGPIAMDGPQFHEILAAVRAEDFESGKLDVLRDATDHAWYTVAQVKQVLDVFSFGSGKLKALEIMAPQIVDLENKFKIYGAFTFDSDKKKAKKILSAVTR
ncbi:MAG: DUF4476 domain-containing protein [Deltaproteobacteria bacterium]|nr:DUF4476 domain-containing protein [Deltaproteobacteria bacterium]